MPICGWSIPPRRRLVNPDRDRHPRACAGQHPDAVDAHVRLQQGQPGPGSDALEQGFCRSPSRSVTIRLQFNDMSLRPGLGRSLGAAHPH